MIPANWSPTTLNTPEPVPIPAASASIAPAAGSSWRHIAGSARGGTLSYADLNAYTWWAGGGFITLNRGHRGIRRTHRGAEDVAQVQK